MDWTVRSTFAYVGRANILIIVENCDPPELVFIKNESKAIIRWRSNSLIFLGKGGNINFSNI